MARFGKPSVLQSAIAVSIALHAVLLMAHAVDPIAFTRAFRDTPLEVILVNARASEAPAKARAIAQANLAGGGELDKGRSTSPLPASAEVRIGDAPDTARRSVDKAADAQQQLLAAMRRELATLPPPDPRRETGTPQERQLEERTRYLLRQLAEIEKRVNEESERPRKRYIGPATKEAVYAVYYDHLRRKIEARGTRDFPTVNGRKIYGELTMNVTVDAAGQVVDTEIVRRSATSVLDQRAVAIVRASAPFGAFPDDMRKQADQIIVTSRFRFTRDDGLEATLSASHKP